MPVKPRDLERLALDCEREATAAAEPAATALRRLAATLNARASRTGAHKAPGPA